MRETRIGVQWAPGRPTFAPRTVIAVLLGALLLAVSAPSAPTNAATNYLLMPRSELLTRPTSGNAWSNLKAVASASLGTPNLCDQDEDHHLRTLASALVFARTGSASYGTKARAGVMAAIKTQTVGCSNAVLALGRQLMAYVLAADFADLSGANDSTFRSWLSAIRTRNIGGHSTWYTLSRTHSISANNWGAYAGASRIAASRYLGDNTDLSRAALVTRGFLGDRAAYKGFTMQLSSAGLSWSCLSAATYTPENKACTKSGINVDGAIVTDISRGGSLRWPPGDDGVSYQLESIQGVGLQVELLYRAGYSAAWDWSAKAMKRAAGVVTRSKASGGKGWNETNAARQMPWLLNKRYGTKIPTVESNMGRAIGFTDWLWGAGGGSAPPPTPTPTPAPGSLPVVTTPAVRLSTSSGVPTSGVPAVVIWSLASSDDPLSRYQLQVKVDNGAFSSRTLSSAKARLYRTTLSSGHEYTFRVRAVDTAGRYGAWKTVGPKQGSAVSDASSAVRWAGSWSLAAHSSYLGRKAHWTKSNGATSRLTFNGSSIAWVGPVGPTRGKANVYIDGKYIKTVDLRASTFRARRIVFATAVSQGTHTIVIRGLGTSGRPTVAVDAYYVVRPG